MQPEKIKKSSSYANSSTYLPISLSIYHCQNIIPSRAGAFVNTTPQNSPILCPGPIKCKLVRFTLFFFFLNWLFHFLHILLCSLSIKVSSSYRQLEGRSHIKIEKELIISILHLLTNYILTEKHSH